MLRDKHKMCARLGLTLVAVVAGLVGCSSLSRQAALDKPRALWAPVNGPHGGPINDLALDNAGTRYAATRQGLFRRQSGHDAWTRLPTLARLETRTRALGTVAKTEPVQSLLTGPNGMLYARTAFHLLRSRDRGERWQSLDAALKRDTGARPTDITTLQPGRDGAVFVGTRRQGLLRSVDAGESWQRVLEVTPPPRIDAGPIAAAGRFYVAASTRGEDLHRLPQLYHSDNGTDWQRLPDPPVPIRHFASDSDGRLIAAGWRWLDQGRRMELYTSTDSGASWMRGELPVERLVALASSPTGNLYAFGKVALYRHDSTGVWHRLTIRRPGFQGLRGSLQAIAWNEHQLYVATDLGIWRSNNRGESWQSFQRAPRAAAVSRFATAGERLYALAARRLYAATDDARNWHPIPNASDIHHLTTSPDGVLFAATADDIYTYSADTNWRRRPRPDGGISGLAAASDGSLLMYGKRRLLRLIQDHVARIDAAPFSGDLIGTLRAGPDGLVLADRVERGVARSLDNGRTWQDVADNAFGKAEPPDGIEFFHFAPNDAIYAVDGPRLYRSTDRGTSWQRLRPITPSHPPEQHHAPQTRTITSLATPTDGGLFAGTRRGGVYRWNQRSQTWRPILSGLPTGKIQALTVTTYDHILAATPHGVFRTTVEARRLGQAQTRRSQTEQ